MSVSSETSSQGTVCTDADRAVRYARAPMSAVASDETPDQWKHFIALNKQFFVDNPGVKPCTTKN